MDKFNNSILDQCSLTLVNFILTLENLGPRVNDSWDSDPSENPEAEIKSYLPPGQVQNLGGQAAVKSSLPPRASAEEILMSTPVSLQLKLLIGHSTIRLKVKLFVCPRPPDPQFTPDSKNYIAFSRGKNIFITCRQNVR